MSLKTPQVTVESEVNCLEDVKDETGFDSYQSYLNEHYDGMPHLAGFIGGNSITDGAFEGDCAIFDITETGSLSAALDVALEDLSPGFTEILAALRDPPSESLLRVLLLRPKDLEKRLPWSLMDVIGLVRHRGPLESPWPYVFEQLFCSNIKITQRTPMDFDALLVHALLPLLETCLERLKGAYDEASIRYRQRVGTSSQDPSILWKNAQEDHENEMEEVRFRLRRWISYYERILNHFSDFLRTQGVSNFQLYEAFAIVSEESKHCLEDSRGLEAEIRDWLLLRVGSLALQESKKSIQLSNAQMEEARR
ncbi:MAG: hypothetical protein Q9195_008892, partial [Heterodermia aff. obscurata]